MNHNIGNKDALGDEIILGNIYGYSIDSNGITTTTVGKAIKFNEKGSITLETISSRRSLWMCEGNEQTIAKKVCVKGAKLFPVNFVSEEDKKHIDDVLENTKYLSELYDDKINYTIRKVYKNIDNEIPKEIQSQYNILINILKDESRESDINKVEQRIEELCKLYPSLKD